MVAREHRIDALEYGDRDAQMQAGRAAKETSRWGTCTLRGVAIATLARTPTGGGASEVVPTDRRADRGRCDCDRPNNPPRKLPGGPAPRGGAILGQLALQLFNLGLGIPEREIQS